MSIFVISELTMKLVRFGDSFEAVFCLVQLVSQAGQLLKQLFESLLNFVKIWNFNKRKGPQGVNGIQCSVHCIHVQVDPTSLFNRIS